MFSRLAALLLPAHVLAAGVQIPLGKDCRVEWDANAAADKVDRYRVDWSDREDMTSRRGSAEVTTINTTCSALKIPNNTPGQYYLQAFAHNVSGWSDPSNTLPFEYVSTIQPPTIMYSSTAELLDPAPLDGAAITTDTLHLHFRDGGDWAGRVDRVVFYCCKAEGEEHTQTRTEQRTPYQMAADLSAYPVGSEREVYADVFFNDGTPHQSFEVHFTIHDPDQPPPPPRPAPPGGFRLKWVIENATTTILIEQP